MKELSSPHFFSRFKDKNDPQKQENRIVKTNMIIKNLREYTHGYQKKG